MLIRVTESIDYFKPRWFTDWILKVGKAQANRDSKKALKIGSRIDEIIRSGICEAKEKDSKEVKLSLKNFLAWKSRHNINSIKFLPRIENDSIGITGEADFYCEEIDTLIDFKSSKRIYPEYIFQLGGYKRLGFPGSKLGILRCGKEPDDFEFKTNEDLGLSLETCIDAFESAYKHYKYYTHINAQLGEMP